MRLFRLLTITAETGSMLESGSLLDQPDWYIDLLGWFIPRYDSLKWHSKAKMLLGTEKKQNTKAFKHGNNHR